MGLLVPSMRAGTPGRGRLSLSGINAMFDGMVISETLQQSRHHRRLEEGMVLMRDGKTSSDDI